MFAGAYQNALRSKPKPGLRMFILFYWHPGCGSLFFSLFKHYRCGTLIRRPRHPSAMAPPMAGTTVQGGTWIPLSPKCPARRHSKGLWRHTVRRSDSGGNTNRQRAVGPRRWRTRRQAPQTAVTTGAEGQTITLPAVGAGKRRATMEEAPQTCRCWGGRVLNSIDHPPLLLHGCTRGRSARQGR
jgi:hypothetical protein